MARTRAQAHAEEEDKSTTSPHAREERSKKENTKPNEKTSLDVKRQSVGTTFKKRSAPTDGEASAKKKVKPEPKSKHQSTPKEDSEPTGASVGDSKLDKFIEEYGYIPLSDLGLADPEKATDETVLAHILNALLSSGRIGRDIAHKTLQRLID
jgi:hypothetical protein